MLLLTVAVQQRQGNSLYQPCAKFSRGIPVRIDGTTEIYGILGNPVSHSLSPAMHNAAFAATELNKAYVAFQVEDVRAALEGCRELRIRGLSVTIPHKQAVIPCLDAIDPVAEKIGAVNTLVISEKKIQGYNTDWIGANRALAEEIPLAGKKILILGSGGSARAIGFGLIEAGAEVAIASRTPEKGKKLAESLRCPWHPLSEAASLSADVLVNATSVGMSPYADTSPVSEAALVNFPVMMDIVYSPLETLLMRKAKEAGCKVIGGLAMLLYQGAAQFELWTGQSAPVEVMRKALLLGLQDKQQS